MKWSHGLKALPELASAALLLGLWIEPQRVGVEWFRSGVFTLILEFFVINASGFMAVLMYDPETPARKRALQVAGLGAGYLVFISAFAWGFDAWWMLAAFAWLCFSKLQAIWSGAAPTERDRGAAIVSWALSVAVYLGAVFVTVMLDVPMLGVTPEVRDARGLRRGRRRLGGRTAARHRGSGALLHAHGPEPPVLRAGAEVLAWNSFSCSARHISFPEAVRGRASLNSIRRGAL